MRSATLKLITNTFRTIIYLLQWSTWRRRHLQRAMTNHYRRRDWLVSILLVSILRVLVDRAFDVGLDELDLGKDLVGGRGPNERFARCQQCAGLQAASVWMRRGGRQEPG